MSATFSDRQVLRRARRLLTEYATSLKRGFALPNGEFPPEEQENAVTHQQCMEVADRLRTMVPDQRRRAR